MQLRKILKFIIEYYWRSPTSREEHLNTSSALREASPTFAAIIALVEMEYPKLYIDLNTPRYNHETAPRVEQMTGRGASGTTHTNSMPTIKHLFVGLKMPQSDSPTFEVCRMNLENLEFLLSDSLRTFRSLTLQPSGRSFTRASYMDFFFFISTAFPALTHLHFDVSLCEGWNVHQCQGTFLGTAFPALIFLRLSNPLGCQCAALPGDVHEENCILLGVASACPALQNIQIDATGTLAGTKLPLTVRRLTIVARRMHDSGRELKSTFLGYNVVAAVRRGLFCNLGEGGRGVVRKVEVLSPTDKIIAMDRVRDACAEYGIVFERTSEGDLQVLV
ncbi:uncharacterized protein BXZ73DRAFT_82433 [Epithele typhae]|uniref:uncharacterized protein n=1 Tax=Epithele typhae TaxID=378194 RepID=UPI002008B62E|nr:uncharacterized protein BXZ73DRAFT_82433 [Epithele typhae]KAH9912133.1 hypothetical protein BXZ73DRAFT_82433 [Epithele typhae]